jgi:hypothetical protein
MATRKRTLLDSFQLLYPVPPARASEVVINRGDPITLSIKFKEKEYNTHISVRVRCAEILAPNHEEQPKSQQTLQEIELRDMMLDGHSFNAFCERHRHPSHSPGPWSVNV